MKLEAALYHHYELDYARPTPTCPPLTRNGGTLRIKRLSPHKLMPTEHLDDLRAKAKYARERYQLYKAKAYGERPTSAARLRELQQACEQAEARLRFALAEEQRAHPERDSPPHPS